MGGSGAFSLYEHTWVGQAHAIINTTLHAPKHTRPANSPPGERPMFWVVATAKKKKKKLLAVDLLRLQQQRYYTCRRHGRLLCDRLVTTQAAGDRQRAQESHMSYTREAAAVPGCCLLSCLSKLHDLTASFPPFPLWLSPPLMPKPPLLNDMSPSSSSLSARMGSNPSPAKRAIRPCNTPDTRKKKILILRWGEQEGLLGGQNRAYLWMFIETRCPMIWLRERAEPTDFISF